MAAGPAVAADGGVLLLAGGQRLEEAAELGAWVDRWRDRVTGLHAVGGAAAVSETLLEELAAAITGRATTGDRIRAAFERDELSAAEAARLTLYGALEPYRVPDEYVGEVDDRQDTDAEADLFTYFAELDEDSRAELGEYLQDLARNGDPDDAGGDEHRDQALGFSANACPQSPGDPRCTVGVDIDGDGDLEYFVSYDLGTGGVTEDDVDPRNGRSDFVDAIIDSTSQAWQVYEDLGFMMPSEPLDISLWSPILPGRGLSLPFSPTIFIDTDETRVDLRYLPKHELFHQVQYQYIGAFEYFDQGDHMIWWTEATANWAAHQANAQETDPSLQSDAYAERLPTILGVPGQPYDATSRQTDPRATARSSSRSTSTSASQARPRSRRPSRPSVGGSAAGTPRRSSATSSTSRVTASPRRSSATASGPTCSRTRRGR